MDAYRKAPVAASPATPSPEPTREFCESMLRQYDRLVATKQNHVTGTLLVVQNYEMEKLRAALTTEPR